MKKFLRTYNELITIPTFEERLEYLKLAGSIGEDTFGFDRYLNQDFYHSPEWKEIRNDIIIRDCGRDLAMLDEEFEINGLIYVHHMNPIRPEDIINFTAYLTNPNYLVCTSRNTHDYIHYENVELIERNPVVRFPNDTCPWRL